MNLKKIKDILKNKKLQIIGGTISGSLALILIGTMVLNNRNIESKIIVSDNKTISDKDKNNKLENIKDNVADNLIEVDKSENNNQLKEENNSIKDDPASSNIIANEANVPLSEPNKSTSNNTENSQNTINKPTTSVSNTQGNVANNGQQEVENTKPSVGSSSNNKPNNSTSNTPKPDKHTHNWIPVTQVVHHDEQGHNEKVLISEAWTEEIPVYEEQARDICNTCNADLTGLDISAHVKKHMLAGEDKAGHRTEWKKVQVGSNKINHDAVYENKWVVDKAAWDETVTTGHKCSDCGETK